MSHLLLCALLVFTSQVFAEDLLLSGAWWYGDVTSMVEQGGIKLSGHVPEVTLAGTAMNPENLTNFTLKLRWNFGGNSNGVFKVGWGKAFEWSAFDQTAGQVTVQADGQVKVYADGKEIGGLRISVSGQGEVTLMVSQRPHDIALVSEGKETLFPLPADLPATGGYLTLRAEGYEQYNSGVLVVKSVEMEGEGKRVPLTAAQREKDIWRWEKVQVDGNWNTLTNFAKYLQAKEAGRWGYKTDLRIEPVLVRPGETVRFHFRCAEPVPPDCVASVQANYLSEPPGATEPLTLHWRETKDGAHEAVVELKPKQAGNWQVVWRVGGEQLSRVFGVVDNGCAVVRMLITSDRNLFKTNPPPTEYDAIHDAGLSTVFWADYVPFSRSSEDLLGRFKVLMAFHHRWGDQVIPFFNADTIIPGVPDDNLFRVRDDLQREGLQQTVRLWDVLGLGPLDDLGGYTFSRSTPGIASALGVKSIDSLVQWQNWADQWGDNNCWQINIWGAPTVPYYVADDDFRKVAPGRGIMALPQASTSNVRIYSIFTTEGQPQLSFMRQHSDNGEMGESSNIDRFEAAMNLLLAESRYQTGPTFLFVGLENFFDLPDWNEANRLGVKYLVEAARHQRVVFAQARDIADYYQRHYQQQPENWFYWPDIYAGLAKDYKPLQLPDRIELMNASFHTVYEHGSALPQFFWDYTRPWSEPEWSEQPAIRQKYGLVNPALITASNCVPRMVDLTGVSATVTIEPQSGGAEARVVIESPRSLPVLPVALWRIPLYPQTLGRIETSRRARYVRVVDGTTGNLHGVLVCNQVPSGRSVWTVKLHGEPRAPFVAEIHIGARVSGRYFPRANGPSAYLWLTDKQAAGGELTIQVPVGRTLTLHYNDGRTEQTVGGSLQVKLDHTWQHESPMITGLNPLELEQAVFEPRP